MHDLPQAEPVFTIALRHTQKRVRVRPDARELIAQRIDAEFAGVDPAPDPYALADDFIDVVGSHGRLAAGYAVESHDRTRCVSLEVREPAPVSHDTAVAVEQLLADVADAAFTAPDLATRAREQRAALRRELGAPPVTDSTDEPLDDPPVGDDDWTLCEVQFTGYVTDDRAADAAIAAGLVAEDSLIPRRLLLTRAGLERFRAIPREQRIAAGEQLRSPATAIRTR